MSHGVSQRFKGVGDSAQLDFLVDVDGPFKPIDLHTHANTFARESNDAVTYRAKIRNRV